ncbi:hypothetical protein SDC9_153158 [bioreactor metagenome]|uniref:Uncharacterized protein n=1 Tax=bioreactor metagenome TaxID=1076179 RepID=A0A645EZU0_9ZZZZ
MFVTNRCFQLGFINGFQPVYVFLLLLFDTTGEGKFPAQIVVVAISVKLMLEHDRFNLNAIHQNNTEFCVWIDSLLIIRRWINGSPIHNAVFNFS